MKDKKGIIFGIQYFSIHDGKGIRTNVFLKGCSLNCIWCHNPEGIKKKPQLIFNDAKCTGCGKCIALCDAHSMVNGEHILNRNLCTLCFKCIKACQWSALEKTGRKISVSELMKDILSDLRYYKISGGGITLTGGEPLEQSGFAIAILKACSKAGIGTAVETNGLVSTQTFEKALPFVDTFLFDIKESDRERHKKVTGADNDLIMKNLEFLNSRGANIILRCPIIPGLNDRPEHFRFIAELTKKYSSVMGAELMPYHKFGIYKARRLGLKEQPVFPEPGEEMVNTWKQIIIDSGGRLMVY